jgi:hypothetical protein
MRFAFRTRWGFEMVPRAAVCSLLALGLVTVIRYFTGCSSHLSLRLIYHAIVVWLFNDCL